ncbi:hypothetical protein ACHAXM_009895 [Skeletonema potamos]|jgi:hypothetical protein
MTRQRLLSSELSLSSSKTHRRTSSVICNGAIHSEPRSDTVDSMDCSSPDVQRRLRPCADDISSLRTLELIRQLSFDVSLPEIIDMSETEKTVAITPSTPSDLELELECASPPPPNTPSERMMSPPLPPNIKRVEPQVITPPLNRFVMHIHSRARSTSPSEISDGYAMEFDDLMVMENLPEQTGQPNRRRLASDQSPYAVSSASSTSYDDHSFASSTEREMIHWDDPTGCIIDLGINNEVIQDDALGGPPCARLSIDSLQEWNLLCEQEGNVINKMQYISSALSPARPTSMVGDQASSSQESSVEAEEVHMMVVPSLSASLSYTHTGAPSTISISSEFGDVDEVSSNYDGEAALSYSQSIEKSFESSLAGDTFHLHQDKYLKDAAINSSATTFRKHRRYKSDGFVLHPRNQVSLKKRPSHKRGNSLDVSLQSIPENPKSSKSPLGVVAEGRFAGAMASVCDNSLERFVASEYSFDNAVTN